MLTDSEKRVIVFIIVVLLIGSVIRYLYPENIRTEEPISPFPININTATKDELLLLPGIGEVYADRIISFRKKFGYFREKEDLMKIKGIGIKKFKNIKDKIIIGGKNDDIRRQNI